MLRALSLASAVTALMLASPAAHAATIEIPSTPFQLSYTAGAGEANNVTISSQYVAASTSIILTVHDAGVDRISIDNMRGGASPCAPSASPNVMVCTIDLRTMSSVYPDATFVLDVSVKDGSDRVTFDASTTALTTRPVTSDVLPFEGTVFAGTGSDTLSDLGYGPNRPEMHGEDGNDYLRGGIGSNQLFGGDGADVFVGYEDADLMVGGPGADSLTYRDGRDANGVIVNALDDGTALSPTPKSSGSAWDYPSNPSAPIGGYLGDFQGDIVIGIENILGTAYGDVLVGNSAANILTGGGGKDMLFGMNGDDRLVVTGAPGQLYGGAGNDTLNARNGAADTRLNCGAGTDVANLDLIDTGWIACESTIRQ